MFERIERHRAADGFGFTLVMVFVMAMAGPAKATDPPKPPAPTTVSAHSEAEASARAASAAIAGAHAEGGAGGKGGDGGHAAATGGNASASNDGVSMTVESVRQAPSTFSAAASPSAPCYYVNGWNVSAPGTGGGRFKAHRDDECMLFERARLLIEAGRPELAVLILVGREGEVAEASAVVDQAVVNTGESEAVQAADDRCRERVNRLHEACQIEK